MSRPTRMCFPHTRSFNQGAMSPSLIGVGECLHTRQLERACDCTAPHVHGARRPAGCRAGVRDGAGQTERSWQIYQILLRPTEISPHRQISQIFARCARRQICNQISRNPGLGQPPPPTSTVWRAVKFQSLLRGALLTLPFKCRTANTPQTYRKDSGRRGEPTNRTARCLGRTL